MSMAIRQDIASGKWRQIVRAIKMTVGQKQAVAFAGLDVRHYESGSSVRGRPRISKKGNSKLRKTLFMPAIVTMRCTEWGRVFAQRLSSAGKPKMVIIAALMRKMVQITFAILRTRKAFDMKLHEQST